MNKRARRDHLAELKDETRTMIFYEAPHKLQATLKDFYVTFGERPIALVRELTKIHEEVIRTTLTAAMERFETQAPRGEFVVIVGGAEKCEEVELTVEQAVALARDLVAEGLSPTAAAKQAAAETGHRKNEIYKGLVDTE